MKQLFGLLMLLGVTATSLVTQASAQPKPAQEFYAAFMPNQGAAESDNHMRLMIHAPVGTHIVTDVTALNFHLELTAGTDSSLTIDLPGGDPSLGEPTVECRKSISPQAGMAVHVTADRPIEVIAESHKQYSTDSWWVYPTTDLGTEMIAMCFPSSLVHDTPGEFAVIGTADSTHVTINLTDSTELGLSKGVHDYVINNDEVLLIQGDPLDVTNDLTGSIITSDKPVAVVSGHVRAAIPSNAKNVGSTTGSRDFLCEQMLPIATWGSEFVASRFATTQLPDLLRIVSGADANLFRINGVTVKTLAKGQVYDLVQMDPTDVITSSGPIMVGQFMHTSKYSISGSGTPYSDPSLAMVPSMWYHPNEQHILVERGANYANTYVSICAVDTELRTMLFDHMSIEANNLHTIAGTPYTRADIPVDGSDHTITSTNQKYSLMVYAMGADDSYAYGVQSLLTEKDAVSARTALQPDFFTLSDPRPNPASAAQKEIEMIYEATASVSIDWEVFDASGRVVAQARDHTDQTSSSLRIALPKNLTNGQYTITVVATRISSGETITASKKFVLIR